MSAFIDSEKRFDNFIKGITTVAKYMTNQVPKTSLQQEVEATGNNDFIFEEKCSDCGNPLEFRVSRSFYPRARKTMIYGLIVCTFCNKSSKYRRMV